jgi:hypothetical protein
MSSQVCVSFWSSWRWFLSLRWNGDSASFDGDEGELAWDTGDAEGVDGPRKDARRLIVVDGEQCITETARPCYAIAPFGKLVACLLGISSPYKIPATFVRVYKGLMFKVLYHYNLKFSHASQAKKKTTFKNRQNSKENLSAISVTQNFRIREPRVIMVQYPEVDRNIIWYP